MIIENLNNKSVIIFGTGPSLHQYDSSLNKDKILLGSKEIVFYHTIMDYYFIGDGGDKKTRGYYVNPEVYHNYKANCQKFIRLPSDKNKHKTRSSKHPYEWYNTMPENLQKFGFEYYRVKEESFDKEPPFEINKINDAGAISFEIFQICLMNNVKEIFLVGHDCDYTKGTAFTPIAADVVKNHAKTTLMSNWYKLEEFAKKNYPQIKVFNINPVAMKHFNILYI